MVSKKVKGLVLAHWRGKGWRSGMILGQEPVERGFNKVEFEFVSITTVGNEKMTWESVPFFSNTNVDDCIIIRKYCIIKIISYLLNLLRKPFSLHHHSPVQHHAGAAKLLGEHDSIYVVL
jgi:hypothetical protein